MLGVEPKLPVNIDFIKSKKNVKDFSNQKKA